MTYCGREGRIEGSRRKLENELDRHPIDRNAIIEAGVQLCDVAASLPDDDPRRLAYDYFGSKAAQFAFGFGQQSLEELGVTNARKAVRALDAARKMRGE